MRKFVKVLVKKYRGIQACLGLNYPLTSFSRIVENPGSVGFRLGLGIP